MHRPRMRWRREYRHPDAGPGSEAGAASGQARSPRARAEVTPATGTHARLTRAGVRRGRIFPHWRCGAVRRSPRSAQGFIFDGRTIEDFKLSTGTRFRCRPSLGAARPALGSRCWTSWLPRRPQRAGADVVVRGGTGSDDAADRDRLGVAGENERRRRPAPRSASFACSSCGSHRASTPARSLKGLAQFVRIGDRRADLIEALYSEQRSRRLWVSEKSLRGGAVLPSVADRSWLRH